MTRYLTQADVCNRYKVSRWTIWSWRKSGKAGFPAPYWISGHMRWNLDDLTRWERSRQIEPLANDDSPQGATEAA